MTRESEERVRARERANYEEARAPRQSARVTFVVAGRGHFPVDMLRYDCCHPARETDSGVIDRSFIRCTRGEQVVSLIGTREPTTARWESFGWRVVS